MKEIAQERNHTIDRGDTMAVIACFLVDTVDLMDRATRFRIADVLERRLHEDYTTTIMTDPSRRLNHADPVQVVAGISQIIVSLRGEDPERNYVRQSMGLDILE